MQPKWASLSLWMRHNASGLHLHVESFFAVLCRGLCGIPPKRFLWEKGFSGKASCFSVYVCAAVHISFVLWICIVTALWFTCSVWVVSRLYMFVTEEDPRYHFDDWTLEIINVSRRDEGDSIIVCSNAEGKNRTMLKLDVQCEELKLTLTPLPN